MSNLNITLGTFLKGLLSDLTVDGIVDVKQMMLNMGVAVEHAALKTADKGQFFPYGPPDTNLNGQTILLNRNNRPEEDRTVMALLMAEYLLSQLKDRSRVLTCDMFFLQDLRQYRISRQLFLATRLAIPETIINQVDDIQFSAPKYARDAVLLPSFVACAYPRKDVGCLLGIIDNLDANASIARRMMASKVSAKDFLTDMDQTVLSKNFTDTSSSLPREVSRL